MKKYFKIIFIITFAVSLSSDELSWVDTQVEAIKPPRKGIDFSSLKDIKDPYIYLEKQDNEKKTSNGKGRKIASNGTSKSNPKKIVIPLKLTAVINNSVLINEKWYKLDDIISGYKISQVSRTSVILTKGSEKLELSTNDTKNKIKFK